MTDMKSVNGLKSDVQKPNDLNKDNSIKSMILLAWDIKLVVIIQFVRDTMIWWWLKSKISKTWIRLPVVWRVEMVED